MPQWKIAEGHYEMDPIRIHFREDIEVDHQFPICARVTWELAEPDAAGLPDADELQQIDRFNQTLQDRLEKPGLSVLTMVLMSDGQCQWVFYIADAERFETVLEQTLAEGQFPIEASVDQDPKWELYQRLLSGIQYSSDSIVLGSKEAD